MATIENPERQVSWLQQSLSSDRKPIGVLLGAGCPTAIRVGAAHDEPLIPDIAGMTQAVRNDLADREGDSPLLALLDEHFAEDTRSNPSVEDMLTHIRALRAVCGNGTVRKLSAPQLDQLDESICRVIHHVADKSLPTADTAYHHVASWIAAVGRDKPVEVFTTNYDLLMEQALEDRRVPYFDGFAGGREPFFDLRAMEEDVLPPRWARVWKLHGSLNWYQTEAKGVFRGAATNNGARRRVIHPSYLKYEESRRMPYLAMIDRLRAFLRQPAAALVICGYSFRDQHLNEVIVDGLRATQTGTAFALLFDELAKYPEAITLGRTRSNLSILGRDGAVIGAKDVSWQERDSGAAVSGNAVGWLPVDATNVNSKLASNFLLGDFAAFGRFLDELAGNAVATADAENES